MSKRKASSRLEEEESVQRPAVKISRKSSKLKLPLPAPLTVAGNVLVCGQGDVGQLGLGEDMPEKTRPALLGALKDVVDVQAGGMHSVCLTKSGDIYTFGCNDEGALGRDTSEEGSEYVPGKVEGLPRPVIKVTCGDSHTACLLNDGRIFAWGSFRDSHGNMGLTMEGNKREPIQLLPDLQCVSIASGADHLVILTDTGLVYTVGCAEQGQLGRVSSRSAGGESRRGKNPMLLPEHVHLKFKVDRIWATTYSTFVREQGPLGRIFAWGLNNYSQLGVPKSSDLLFTAKPTEFSAIIDLVGGSHHTIVIKSDAKCYAIGRRDYGRLGLGEVATEAVQELTLIETLKNKSISQVSCGDTTSFAVTAEGEVYAWGLGSNSALGTGSEDDALVPTLLTGVQVKGKKVLRVAGGAQHTIFVVATEEVAKSTNGDGKEAVKGAAKESKANGKA